MKRAITRSMLVAAGAVGALVVGCASTPSGLSIGGDGDDKNGNGSDGGSGPAGATCSNVGAAHVGFAGTDLNADRAAAASGADRARIKPFKALAGEYRRALGAAPASLAASSAVFGQPEARWYEEPTPSAVTVYAAFAVGFDGCLTATATDGAYAAAPTATTAAKECADWARTFWSRTATPDEIAACVDVATVQTAKEPDARRKWAYTCAAVTASAGFWTY